ncbi:5-hydroxytryptamine receptor 3A-like isoform X1 [Hemicordylus capensis]|uniref:5-hydroxytryptamine receptor 3A-like isoform X1 n=1 Tax=Hemicordylus capensis TaxID=884348 RepID=UPI00230242DD|nr:5-hydroxytryptamine receptor 3A-like isoform X1 [Hemicordylus capensis]XP_053154452.1 5-hydroxytryptamine receptor 3A-like isoform X1 [Hemicordylus capensis]
MWMLLIFCVIFALIPGAALEQNCTHHNVVEYLNISSDNKLLLYTRPKKNWAEPLEVNLDFTLVSILTVVEKLQVLTTYFWLFVKWKNDFVFWNPSDFCNITHLTLPADKFWVPEISVEEQANEEKSRTSPFVRVSSSGEIMQFQTFHLTSSCSLHIYRFPFDKQKCNLTVLSPMHSDKEVMMKNNEITLEVDAKSRNIYLTNGEWKFNRISSYSYKIVGVEMNYSAVTYQISMQRRPVLYVLNLILPTSALFFLDMAISCTSASSSEKISFKITLILEVSVLSLILNDILPTSSDDPPVIAKFFMGIFMIMVAGLLENYIAMTLKEMKPPHWLLKSKGLVCFRRKKNSFENPIPPPEETVQEQGESTAHTPAGKEGVEKETDVFVRTICSELRLIRNQVSAQRSQAPANRKWNRIVLCVEKLFCYTRVLLSVLFITYITLMWREEK